MSTTITREPEIITPEETAHAPGEAPPIFGRCPVCNKPLRPRCKITGEPKCPPVGTGYESRAKCMGCGTILVYLGGGKWRPLTEDDMTEDDHFANRMGF